MVGPEVPGLTTRTVGGRQSVPPLVVCGGLVFVGVDAGVVPVPDGVGGTVAVVCVPWPPVVVVAVVVVVEPVDVRLGRGSDGTPANAPTTGIVFCDTVVLLTASSATGRSTPDASLDCAMT